MPECPVCQTEYVEGQKFCSACGGNLISLEGSQEQQPSQDMENPGAELENRGDEQDSEVELLIKENKELKIKLKKSNHKIKELTEERDKYRSQVAELGYDNFKEFKERVNRLEQGDRDASQSSSEKEGLAEELAEVKSELQSLAKKQKDSDTSLQTTEQDVEELKSRVSILENQNQVQEGRSHSQTNTAETEPSNENTNTYEEGTQPTGIPWNIDLSEVEQELVNSYPNFSEKHKVVSETEESMNQRRLGASEVMFGTESRGSYWIVEKGGTEYLVPSSKIKINEYSLTTVKASFECHGKPVDANNFQLLKSAKVSYNSGTTTWKLEERGVIQFEGDNSDDES